MKKIPLVSVIDDDKIFQASAQKFLEETGLVEQVLQFPDGENAIEYFIKNKDRAENLPDLVFLDLNMPYLDGWGFLNKFLKINFDKERIAIYISSSSNSRSDKKKSETYNIVKGYLIKPLSRAAFLEIVQIELRKKVERRNKLIQEFEEQLDNSVSQDITQFYATIKRPWYTRQWQKFIQWVR